MANMKIEDIEGIGPAYGEKLRGAGVNDTDGLLEKGKTKKGRSVLAEASGISETLILKWSNMADLFRVKGVGAEFAELLEASGVDTVKELKHRVPTNLVAKMTEVNATKNLVRRVPTDKEVSDWVNQAKELPPMIEY